MSCACVVASHIKVEQKLKKCFDCHVLTVRLYDRKNFFFSCLGPGPSTALMSNTPKLSRIVLKQRRFESARGSTTSDSPEVRLAELDLPEVRSRINAQRGEKLWQIDSNRLDSSRFVFLKVDSTQRKSGRKVLQVCARDTIRHNKERITWTFLVLKASLMRH